MFPPRCAVGLHFIISCVSILTRDIDIAILSVSPSVCLSVRHVPCSMKTAYCIVIVSSPYGSPIINHLRGIQTASPLLGALNTGGV